MKDYLYFKRYIFLSKMNTNIKKESTNKLDDFIFYETKSLEAQINDMKNDYEYVKSYFQKLKKAVDELYDEVKFRFG